MFLKVQTKRASCNEITIVTIWVSIERHDILKEEKVEREVSREKFRDSRDFFFPQQFIFWFIFQV